MPDERYLQQPSGAVQSPMPDKRQCELALEEIVFRSEGSVSLALLAYRDGRPFLFRGNAYHNAGKLAAMASSLAALSGTLLQEVDSDTGELTMLQGKKGKLIVVQVPPAAGMSNSLLLLAVHASEAANLGRLLLHTRACVEAVEAAFGA